MNIYILHCRCDIVKLIYWCEYRTTSHHPAPERFSWSQIHHANNEISSEVWDVGPWNVGIADDLTNQLTNWNDLLATSHEQRHRCLRFTCIDVIAIDKLDIAGSVRETFYVRPSPTLAYCSRLGQPRNLLPTPELCNGPQNPNSATARGDENPSLRQ